MVRLIYKKGDHKQYAKYWPKYIVNSNSLNTYLQNNTLITEYQHGFQKGKSTTILLSKFTDETNQNLHDKKFVIALIFFI